MSSHQQHPQAKRLIALRPDPNYASDLLQNIQDLLNQTQQGTSSLSASRLIGGLTATSVGSIISGQQLPVHSYDAKFSTVPPAMIQDRKWLSGKENESTILSIQPSRQAFQPSPIAVVNIPTLYSTNAPFLLHIDHVEAAAGSAGSEKTTSLEVGKLTDLPTAIQLPEGFECVLEHRVTFDTKDPEIQAA